MEEVWTEFKPRYMVSNFGRVKKFERDEVQEIKPTVLEDGSLQVEAVVRMYRYKMDLAQLVATYFLEGYKEEDKLEFIDGDRTNCRADNLRIATKEPRRRKRNAPVERSDWLPDEVVIWCRDHYIPNDKEYGAAALAAKIGRTRAAVHQMLIGKSYPQVGGKIHVPRGRRD